MLKFLIDADTGIDDSVAIYYALKQKDVRVVGITTSFGNTTAPQGAENTLRLIKMANPGYEVPVVVGENKPLFGEWGGPEYHIHGSNGIGGVELPETEQKPLDVRAEDFIIDMAREHGHELTIITLGRMTNLFDGCSFVIQKNSGAAAPAAGISEEEVKGMIAKALKEFAATLLAQAE